MAASPQLLEKYSILKLLGKGAFSTVWLAEKKDNGEQFAVKVVEKKDLGDYAKNLETEVQILKQLHHPNIVSLVDLIETPDKIYLVMDLVTGGELFDRIVQKGNYSEEDAAILVRKIVDAVVYLHDNNIVHRDLKPENLLLKSEHDDLDVRIADFGFSKIAGEDSLMLTACGTPSYVAPEVLEAEGYGKEVDMWAVGVITYILLCGYPPFYGDTVPVIFEKIMLGEYEYPDEYWGSISAEAKNFIDNLLVVDPACRLTAKQASQHPWLNNHVAKSGPINRTKLEELVAERQRTRSKNTNKVTL